MKRILTIVTILALLCGCSASESEADTLAQERAALAEEYEALDENSLFYAGTQETLEKLLEHGTGVIFLSFPECLWCQGYIGQLNDVLSEAGIEKAMYYNILKDRQEMNDWYRSIASYIEEQDETILGWTNEGDPMLYVPLVLFVENGQIIGWDNETSMEVTSDTNTPETYWTEEKKTALHDKLYALAAEVAKAQSVNDSTGCDEACSFTPSSSN